MEGGLSFENRIKSMNFNKSLSDVSKGNESLMKFVDEVEIIDVESYKYDDIIIHNYSIDNQCTCRVF